MWWTDSPSDSASTLVRHRITLTGGSAPSSRRLHVGQTCKQQAAGGRAAAPQARRLSGELQGYIAVMHVGLPAMIALQFQQYIILSSCCRTARTKLFITSAPAMLHLPPSTHGHHMCNWLHTEVVRVMQGMRSALRRWSEMKSAGGGQRAGVQIGQQRRVFFILHMRRPVHATRCTGCR